MSRVARDDRAELLAWSQASLWPALWVLDADDFLRVVAEDLDDTFKFERDRPFAVFQFQFP